VRVFLYTNVLVAAFATRGLCADVLRTVLAEHELVLSSTVIQELTRTLRDKLRLPDPSVSEIAAFLRASALLADVPPKVPAVPIRDPDDALILGEAVAIGAEVFVTSDKDLLDAREIRDIQVLDPRGFWELVRRGVS
jgi:putative PIN family toxin of toxin-antitoxin system